MLTGPLAQVYEIIAAAGITKGSTVQKQILELEVRLKLIPCGHICMMEARELWQWMKFNADLLKAQNASTVVHKFAAMPNVSVFLMIDQSEPHQMSATLCKFSRVLNGRFIRKVLARALRRNENHLQALMTVYHKGDPKRSCKGYTRIRKETWKVMDNDSGRCMRLMPGLYTMKRDCEEMGHMTHHV
ncbi:hypothetical protein Tco_0408988 [Tanacetum coccineum]